MNGAESNACAVETNKAIVTTARKFDGFGFSASDLVDSRTLTHFNAIANSGHPHSKQSV